MGFTVALVAHAVMVIATTVVLMAFVVGAIAEQRADIVPPA